jgi:hypothetical protein
MTLFPNSRIPRLPWERPRARHWLAALVAVALSCVLHGVLIQQFPPLTMGRPPLRDMPERVRPVVLGSVQVDPVRGWERPERFDARDPALQVAEQLSPDLFQTLVEEWLPPEPLDPGVTLAGESGALAELEEPLERTPWDARQDLMQIRDRVVPDDVAFLPRRLLPDVSRVARAPDVAWPADAADMDMEVRSARWLQAHAAVGAGAPAAVAPVFEPETTVAEEPVLPRVDALVEPVEDITDVAPIDELLSLDMRVFADPADAEHLYFQLRIQRAGDDVLPVLPKDVLLIQDASESMTQAVINEAKVGVGDWLEVLNEGDRFDVIAFRDDVSRSFGEVLPVDMRTKAQARTFIERLRAQGGTDVFASLVPLLEMPVDPARPVLAIFVSDGVPTEGLTDSTEILAQFSDANAGAISVFAVGAGREINEYLLDFISYKNRGDAAIVREVTGVADLLRQVAEELRRPVLTGLRTRVAGREDVEIYPGLLTHLYLDRPLVMYGRAPAEAERIVIQVVGQAGAEVKDMLFPLEFGVAPEGEEGIRTEWVWQKVYHLVGEHIRTRDPEVLTAIRELESAFGLHVAYGRQSVPRDFQRRFRIQSHRAD